MGDQGAFVDGVHSLPLELAIHTSQEDVDQLQKALHLLLYDHNISLAYPFHQAVEARTKNEVRQPVLVLDQFVDKFELVT